jgi:hypothetical protein
MREQQLDIAPALQKLLNEQNQKLYYIQELEKKVNTQIEFLNSLEETFAYYLEVEKEDLVFSKVTDSQGILTVDVKRKGDTDSIVSPESMLNLLSTTVSYIEEQNLLINKERNLFLSLINLAFDFSSLSDEERKKVELSMVGNDVILILKK